MEENFIKIYHWLYPLSWLYGIGVCLRNKLFDWGWLRSKSFDVPVICVGNLAVGGTGKTPHTEYLIKLLQKNGVNVATLSRGYKRKSRGYVLADDKSNVRQIGDEPYQIKNKFPNARVAVDENRCHGIEQLLKLENPTVEAIILDDAFQHRHVKAGLNILLTDFHRLLCDDALLPAGRLREPSSGKNRAQMVIVTNVRMTSSDRLQHHSQTAPPLSIPTTVFLQIPLWNVDPAISRENEQLESALLPHRRRASTASDRHRLPRPLAERSGILHAARQIAGI